MSSFQAELCYENGNMRSIGYLLNLLSCLRFYHYFASPIPQSRPKSLNRSLHLWYSSFEPLVHPLLHIINLSRCSTVLQVIVGLPCNSQSHADQDVLGLLPPIISNYSIAFSVSHENRYFPPRVCNHIGYLVSERYIARQCNDSTKLAFWRETRLKVNCVSWVWIYSGRVSVPIMIWRSPGWIHQQSPSLVRCPCQFAPQLSCW